MCHAIDKRVLLIGTQSADYIRASSPSGCIQRPNTWLHPNPSLKCQIPLATRAVAVGTEIALRPPHRSRRALLTHRAPTLDGDEEPLLGPRMQDTWVWQVPVGDRLHSGPRQPTPLTPARESTVPTVDHVMPEC